MSSHCKKSREGILGVIYTLGPIRTGTRLGLAGGVFILPEVALVGHRAPLGVTFIPRIGLGEPGKKGSGKESHHPGLTGLEH